jgi:CRISP-associated protein Cas1
VKTHLNTLFVTTEGAYLSKDGQAVAVRVEKTTRLRIPLHNLESIACFGRIGMSPQLMAACAESGVSISFLSITGRFRAAVLGFTPGNVHLRRAQYRRADNEAACVETCRMIILGKLANARTVLLRGARDAASSEKAEALQYAAGRLSALVPHIRAATNADALRGLEGEAATLYFPALNSLISAANEVFQFTRRSRRPPLDPLNCLLSFVYSLLAHDVRSACESVGLGAAVGFLHRDRPGRPGMALDLMEEFRPWLADRLVLSLINRRQVSPEDFKTLETGAVVMSDSARRTLLVAWQERKQEELLHPFIDDRVSLGILLHVQARLMARFLRGDLDAYPPFLWK